MNVSQYSSTSLADKKRGAQVLTASYIAILAIMFISVAVFAPQGMGMNIHFILGMTAPYTVLKYAITTAVTAVATYLAGAYASRNLGGMNGDVAGYSICLGEVAGLIALALN